MTRNRFATAFTLLLIGVLGLALLWPIAAVVRAGFIDQGKFTFGWFEDVFNDRFTLMELRNSILLATAATALCLLISIPLALISENFNFAGKRIWLALIQVPMILPPFVGAIGLKSILSRNGGINALLAWMGIIDPRSPIEWDAYPFWTVAVLESLYLYPITFLNVQAALANIDPALDEAARNLGSSAWRRFWRITLPLMRPGIFAGATIVFIWVFTEIGTPMLVGYTQLTAVRVFSEIDKHAPAGDAYALTIILLAVSILMYAIGKSILGRPASAMLAKATVAAQPQKLGWLSGLAATAPFALVFMLAVLPHISVVLASVSSTGMIEWQFDKMTMKYHTELLSDVWNIGKPNRGLPAISIVNSLKYSVLATALSIVLGFAIAYLAVRRRSWLTALLDNLAMLPLAVPGLVIAFGYFAITQGNSVIAFLNPLEHDPMPLLVIAYTVRRLPFIVRSCAAGLEQTSEALEEAAANLGAGRLRIMLSIVVPLLMANFIAGGLLVFSRSMLEVSDSLILAFDRNAYPMTKAMYALVQQPQAGLQLAAALGVWGMVILSVTILGASLALGKRLGALFRV